MHKLYIVKGLSPYKIAPRYNCEPGTIRRWLIIYGFPIRKKKFIIVSKKELKLLYCNKRLSLSQIGKLLGCTPSGLLQIFRKFSLPLRNLSESSKYYTSRCNFNSTKSLKAYMIGFRVGDLHVREEGRLIKIGSGTTKKEQLALFNELFKTYGKVYIGRKDKKGAWHPSVALNESFSFLIPKYRTIPDWIQRSKKYFLSFVAGYVDAEGNIGCYPRARLKIVSYDYNILRDIGSGLKKYFNIKPVYFLEKTKRTTHNKDALSLTINNMHSMHAFLSHLIPNLKHGKRKNDALITFESIKNRKYFDAKQILHYN